MKPLNHQFLECIIKDNPHIENSVSLFFTQENFIAWLRFISIDIQNNASEEVKDELHRLFAVKDLIRDNELACEVEIKGVKVSLCDNITIKSAINNNIIQIYKHLHGEPNTWE